MLGELLALGLTLFLILLAFTLIFGGRKGAAGLIGAVFSGVGGCLKPLVGCFVVMLVGLVLVNAGMNRVKSIFRHQPSNPPSVPSPSPPVEDKTPRHFDYPVGDPDNEGRREGKGWYVSQDFADVCNAYREKLSGQHLGEDRLKKSKPFAGEAVYAIGNGTILAARADKSYGHYVIIKHPLPEGSDPPYVMSFYGHLASNDVVAEGEEVDLGERIGRIGEKGDNGIAKNTGNPWAVHLHFEMRRPTREHADDWRGYGYSPQHSEFLNPTDATSDCNEPGGGWIDGHR